MKEFNSQVCTTKEQSQRLLDLGLKPETADMAHIAFGGGGMMIRPYNWVSTTEVDINNFYPAWSLHRLFDIMYVHCHELKACENVYDAMIKRIEKTIEHNTHNEYYFNKEYLKQCRTKVNTESI